MKLVLVALLAGLGLVAVAIPNVRQELTLRRERQIRSALRAIYVAEFAYRTRGQSTLTTPDGPDPGGYHLHGTGLMPEDATYASLDQLVRANLLDPTVLTACEGYSFVASPSSQLPGDRWFAMATPVTSSSDERPWLIGKVEHKQATLTGPSGPYGDLYFPTEIQGPVKLDVAACKLEGVVAVHSTKFGRVVPVN